MKLKDLPSVKRIFPTQAQPVVFAFIIGIFAAFGNIILRFMVEGMEKHFLMPLEAAAEKDFQMRLVIILVPVIGAVLLYIFIKLFRVKRIGYGFPFFLENVNLKGAVISFREIIEQIIGPAITLGFGGSAGLEGPSARIGGGVGSIVGSYTGASGKRRRLFVASGSAAAIAANFNAPIAGVFFALEIVLVGEYELESLGAIITASAMGTVVSRAVFENHPIFDIPHYTMKTPLELLYYVGLGVVVAFFSVFFIKLFYGIDDALNRFWDRLGVKDVLPKLVVGFLLVGLIGAFTPQILGGGYMYIHKVLIGNVGVLLLFTLIFTKMLATAFTLNSGGLGGMFGPAIFMGAVIGGAYGGFLNMVFHTSISPGAYATVGFGAFLAALTHAPFTGIFLLFEMTGDYQIMVPAMIASVIGVVIARILHPYSIDTHALARKGIILEAGKEVGVLGGIKVSELTKPAFVAVSPHTPLKEILRLVTQTDFPYFPVINDKGELVGIVSLQDLRSVLLEGEELGNLVVAEDIATKDIISVSPDDDLNKVLSKFSIKDLEALPVVEKDEEGRKKLIGFVNRGDVLARYNQEIIQKFSEQEKGESSKDGKGQSE